MNISQHLQQYLDPEVALFGHQMNEKITIEDNVEVIDGTIVIKQKHMSLNRINNFLTLLQEEKQAEGDYDQDFDEYEHYEMMKKQKDYGYYDENDFYENIREERKQIDKYDYDEENEEENEEDNEEENDEENESWETYEKEEEYLEVKQSINDKDE